MCTQEKDTIVQVDLDPGIRCIGVVADSHVPVRAPYLPPELFKRLQGVELILHAGDLVTENVLLELEAVAPVVAVAGNMDPPRLRRQLKRRKLLVGGGLKMGLIHGDGLFRQPRKRALEVFSGLRPQVIVFGHSHRPLCEYSGETLLFNPGSCVDPRWEDRPSCGLLYPGADGVTGEIIYL